MSSVPSRSLGGAANALKNVDLASDGKRIVALMPVETDDDQKAQSRVTFFENSFDELRGKAPVGE
jgi:hypothetical protein